MSKSRKLALFTAVNIDGRRIEDLKRDRDAWYFDPRIERKYQMDPKVYKHPELDRGHLVRRLDPVWGRDAEKANEETFHFTNCSPQHSKLNQRTWLDLESYILNNAKVNDLKVTVFTGPVFRDSDKVDLHKFAIPAEFWKVVIIRKADRSLSATAYLQSQRIGSIVGFGITLLKTYPNLWKDILENVDIAVDTLPQWVGSSIMILIAIISLLAYYGKDFISDWLISDNPAEQFLALLFGAAFGVLVEISLFYTLQTIRRYWIY